MGTIQFLQQFILAQNQRCQLVVLAFYTYQTGLMGHICVQLCEPIPGTVKCFQKLTISDIQLLQIVVRAIEHHQIFQMRYIQLFQLVLGTIQIVDIRVLAQVQLGQLIL